MKRSAFAPRAIACATALVTALTATLDATAAETWLQKVLRISGISAAPAPRASAPVESGSVWVAAIDGTTRTRWTAAEDFGSPVFDARGTAIYAMQRDSLVRIASPNAEPEVVRKVVGVDKLIGFDPLAPADLVVLMRDEKAPVAVLSVSSPSLVRQSVDLSVLDQQRLVANLRGQNRSVGALRVIVDKLDRESLAGVVEWTDVFVEDGSTARRNLSRCEGVNCGQPALSPDRARVVYVRSAN